MDYDKALPIILRYEGGYSNNHLDRGGETNLGITQQVYDTYRNSLMLPKRSVKYIEKGEISVIYLKGYWLPCKCAELPYPLDLFVFDCSVLQGPSRAIKTLQKILGVTVDGVIGSKTLEAIKTIDVQIVCSSYLTARESFFDKIVENDLSQSIFLRGWRNRISHLRQYLE